MILEQGARFQYAVRAEGETCRLQHRFSNRGGSRSARAAGVGSGICGPGSGVEGGKRCRMDCNGRQCPGAGRNIRRTDAPVGANNQFILSPGTLDPAFCCLLRRDARQT